MAYVRSLYEGLIFPTIAHCDRSALLTTTARNWLALNAPEPTHNSPEFRVAGCLKSDAEYEKMSTIDLAKKRLGAAQEWRAQGIF